MVQGVLTGSPKGFACTIDFDIMDDTSTAHARASSSA